MENGFKGYMLEAGELIKGCCHRPGEQRWGFSGGSRRPNGTGMTEMTELFRRAVWCQLA